ncbi:MAG: hypothetical protein IJ086_00255 [Clostridium sp.]|nr:hypothetical protein [Clostridium sp.]
MEKIKNFFNNIKESSFVKYSLDKLKPTFKVVKCDKAYKIVLMALIIDLILIPFNIVSSFITKVLDELFGGFSSFGVSPLDLLETMSYSFKFASFGEIAQMIIFSIISLVFGLISFVLVNLYLPNGALNSFKIYIEEKRIVKFKEFISLTKVNIKGYISTLFKVVALPLLCIHLLGYLVNLIPYVSGISLSRLIIRFVKYGLLFNMYSSLLGFNGEEQMNKHLNNWALYAAFVYIVSCSTSLGLVVKALNISFILYTLLHLYNCNSYDEEISIEEQNVSDSIDLPNLNSREEITSSRDDIDNRHSNDDLRKNINNNYNINEHKENFESKSNIVDKIDESDYMFDMNSENFSTDSYFNNNKQESLSSNDKEDDLFINDDIFSDFETKLDDDFNFKF